MRQLAVVALMALIADPGGAFQLDADLESRIDSLFTDFDRTAGPGCAVGVVREGRLVFERGYGMGNLDLGIPLSGSSVFYLASVSKQFTAAAVLIAAHEGHLSLDDDLREHIPEFTDYGTTVTIRHLIHHTAGVRDYLRLMELAGIPFENVLTDDDMLGLINRQREVNFAPGSQYLYSNSGYVLLAEVVRRATGRSLREYAKAKIFDPLGMMDTHFHDDRTHVVKNRVFSYDRPQGGEWSTNYLMNFDKVGDGGLYSTVRDLARWDEAFYADRLGVPDFANQMYVRGVLTDGDTIGYARGLGVGLRRGLRRVSHGGGLMAFRTMISRYPDQQTTVITLCNAGSATSGTLPAAVEDLVLQASFPEAPPAAGSSTAPSEPEPDDIDVPSPALRELEGDYYSEELASTWQLESGDGRLILNHPSGESIRLAPHTESVFAAGGLSLQFVREGGQVVAFVLQAGRVQNMRFDRRQLPSNCFCVLNR